MATKGQASQMGGDPCPKIVYSTSYEVSFRRVSQGDHNE